MGFIRTGRKRDYEIEQEKAQQLLEEKEKYITLLLEKNGINLNKFLTSNFYNNPNKYSFVDHIYCLLKGYKLSYTSSHGYNERGHIYFYFERIEEPTGYIINLDTVKIEFSDNSLMIIDPAVTYKYEIDEHCKFYLNGEYAAGQHVPTEKEIMESRQQLHNNLKSHRLRREKNMIDSIEFSKTFNVK